MTHIQPSTKKIICRNWVILCVCLFGIVYDASASSSEKPLNILFLSTFSKDLPAQKSFEDGLDKVLKFREGRHNLFFEFMDASRLPAENTDYFYTRYLEIKYKNIQFDFVIGWALSAIKLLSSHQEMFSPAHHIYVEDFSGDPAEHEWRSQHATLIGVQEDYQLTLKEIVRLRNPERIYIIGTSNDSSSQSRIRLFKDSLQRTDTRAGTEYLLDLPLDQIASLLKGKTGENAVAFYLLMFTDGRGRSLSPYAAAEILTRHSQIPVFSYWESLMGSGIVGGHMMSIEIIGAKVGETIQNFNERNSVPIVLPLRYVYDYLALKRWKIDVAGLPDEAIILHRPPDIISAYRFQLLGVLAIILGLSALSAALIRVLRLRNAAVNDLAAERRNLTKTVEDRTRALSSANQELKVSEERFRSLCEAAFEGIVFLEKGIIIEINNACCDIFGYLEDEVLNRPAVDFIVPEERIKVAEKITSASEEPYESEGLREDGSTFPIEINAKMFTYKGREVRVTSIRDLSRQKQAEEEIKILRGILPICSFCKKIRDDKGYWEQVDIYINKYSEADFSHSVCPDCLKIHYPDQLKEMKKKKE